MLYDLLVCLPQAPFRPAVQRAHRNVTCHASDTDKSARKTSPRSHGDDGESLGSHKSPPDQVAQSLRPSKAAEEDLGQSVTSAAAGTDEVSVKQQLSPLTSRDEVDVSMPPDPELEVNATVLLPTEAAKEQLEQSAITAKAVLDTTSVKQKLSPLTSQDEVDLTAPPDPELEVNATVVIQKVVSYQTPKTHRRRPGNSFVLAGRNFVVELKVRTNSLVIASQSRAAACVICCLAVCIQMYPPA